MSVEVGLQPGDVVEGRYILLEELGRGPLFVVFRALQKRVNRHVILRAVAPAFKGNKGDSFFGDFEKEALLSSRLRHHNTVIFFDFGLTPEGTLYRVSEQLGGESLRVRLDREKILPLPQVVKIVRQIARSLGEAHSMGIVHAELRPESVILMNLQGEDDFVKVIAYGISALRAAVGLEPKNRPLVQTIVEAGLDPLSPGADVFGLGMIMYEMMVGLRPVMDGGTLKPPALPLQVESSLLGRVFRRATSYEAADRFEDGNAFLAALDGFEAQTEASRVVQVGRSAVNSKEMQALSRRDVEALDAQEPPRTNPGLRERKNPLEGEIGWRPPILSSSRRVRARRRVPIVGRRRERDDIMRVCAEVSGQRQGRVVLVGGGIGVGKTRLMRWVRDEAELPAEMAVGLADCSGEAPLRGFSAALLMALRSTSRRKGAPLSLAHHVAEVFGRELLSEEQRVLLTLAETAGPAAAAPWLRTLARVVIALARVRPMVLVCDDLDGADEGLRFLLEELVRAMDHYDVPLMVVGSIRREGVLNRGQSFSDWLVFFSGHDRTEIIDLESLERDEAMTLSRLLIERASTDEVKAAASVKLVSLIAQRSFGNARYIESAVKSLREKKLLIATIDGVGIDQESEPEVKLHGLLMDDLYRSVESFCQPRSDRGRVLAFLRVCAIMGTPLPVGLMSQAWVMDEEATVEEFQAFLRELLQQDFMLELDEGHRCTFSHPLMGELLVKRPGQNVELHACAALAKHRYYFGIGELSEHLYEINQHRALSTHPLGWQATE